MKNNELRQMLKNEALNKIRKLFDPKRKTNYSPYLTEDGSHSEQRDYMVFRIIEDLEIQLK